MSPPITMKAFIDMLTEAEFNVQEYQSRLFITSQEDIPFKAISRELQDCDFNDFTPDSEYYLLSNAWFYRWYLSSYLGHSITNNSILRLIDTK